MLSDAALGLAVGCDIKWLYNSARRLSRPIRRALDEATWWRLVHHLAVRLGVSLADAAQASDMLLAPGMHPGRVRLRATPDESVSVVVDLGRFHDGAALALAAAQFLAVPRPRGRPKIKGTDGTPPQFSPDEMATVLRLRVLDPAARLSAALDGIPGKDPVDDEARRVLLSLSDAKIPFVIVGESAAAYHGAPWAATSLDLCADPSPRHSTAFAIVLNSLNAEPRGTATREGFRVDASLLRAVPMLALRIGSLDLNIYHEIGDVGEYQQVALKTVRVGTEDSAVFVLSLEALLQSETPGALGVSGEHQRRRTLLRTIQGMDFGTR